MFRLHRLGALALAGLLFGCGGGGTTPSIAFVLRGAPEAPSPNALYGYDARGQLLHRVSGAHGLGWGVFDARMSPDRRWMAFVDDKSGFDRDQGFIADLEHPSDPVAFTEAPPAPTSLTILAWSPDSTCLAVHSDLLDQGSARLFCVPRGGGPPAPLSTLGQILASSTTFWSPDSTRIAWKEGPTNNGPWKQMVANADGTSIVEVSGGMVAGGGVRLDQNANPWSSTSARVVFVADKEVDEKFELFAVDANGAALLKLSPVLGAGVNVTAFACAPTDALVAFRISGATPSLHVGPISGAVPAVLQSSATEWVSELRWHPTIARVAWRSFDSVDTRYHLRARDAGAAFATNLVTAAPGEDLSSGWGWSPTGGRIAFLAGDADVVQDHLQIYAVAGDGSAAPVNLVPAVTATGNVLEYGWSWSLDGTRLLVKASAMDVAIVDLYLAHADGSGATQISTNGPFQTGIGTARFSGDGRATAWIQGYSEPDAQLLVAGPLGDNVHVAEFGGPGQEFDELLAR